MSPGSYFLRRLLDGVPTFFGITLLVFVILLVVPGNPAQLIQGEMADPEVTAHLVRKWGLDEPPLTRYVTWLKSVAALDFGISLVSGTPVLDSVLGALVNSAILGLSALILAIALSIPLGVWVGARPNTRFDYTVMLVALGGISIPTFVTGLLLQLVMARNLGILPVSGMGESILSLDMLRHLAMPAASAAFLLAAIDIRLVRSSVLEVSHEDFVRTARAKGLARRRVLFRHILPNALIPVITMFGLHFRSLFAGLLLVEVIFSWPGIGRLFFDAVAFRDYPLIQATSLVTALGVFLINLAVDLLYSVVDPRIRMGGIEA